MRLVDVFHLGRPRVIGAWLVDGCLIDPGPASSLDGLIAGLGEERPRRLLLTHIHLDHAGAAGTLAERWPDLEVWVHEKGAPHVADPSKLLSSATRLYGDDMDRLWGEVLPVPEDRLRVLRGGEHIGDWHVEYTPGHASHHVSFLHTPTRTAFTGDTGGVRIAGGPVIPPTPPPDIDLDAWVESVDRIASWDPARIAITHFGAYDDVASHLDALRAGLRRVAGWARDTDAEEFADRVRDHVAMRVDDETAAEYEQAMPAWTLWPGLDRALRRVSSSG